MSAQADPAAPDSEQSSKPPSHHALALLAETQLHNNHPSEAFALYMQAVNACPSVRSYKERFLDLARSGIGISHSKELEDAFAACLKTPELASELENWSALLLSNPDFHATYALADRAPFDPDNQAHFRGLTDLTLLMRPLFLEGVKNHVVCDPVFEDFMTHIRRHLLDRLSEGGDSWHRELVALAVSVAHYASLTDFVLNLSDDERARIGELQRRIETDSVSVNNEASVAVFACYRPLQALRNSDKILLTFKGPDLMGPLVKAQIKDRIWIEATAAGMRAETSVGYDRSNSVREQYESFPYPQWTTLSKRIVVREWLLDGPSQRVEGFLHHTAAKILIAGCGTGRRGRRSGQRRRR